MMDKADSLKVNINNRSGQKYMESVAIYVPMFRTTSTESLLKFVTILNKIIKGQDLSMVPQNYGMTQNLVIVDDL